MPEYLVTFAGTVVDQPDHPKRNVPVTDGLRVNAPQPEAAFIHAIRVTRGDGTPQGVYDVTTGALVYGVGPAQLDIAPPQPPAVEPTKDRIEVFHA